MAGVSGGEVCTFEYELEFTEMFGELGLQRSAFSVGELLYFSPYQMIANI